ncbi:hypothetical protein IJI31_03640 [bacterium]|nr:hypothetical protein [bacterium]
MKKITKSALLISGLISAGMAFSADTFKNSILDMSMKKELNNTVSLTIYTSKPYNENLFITKRNATTYVILFPETNTDIKKEISKVETEGLIQKVDVKTQPYNDQNGKGYTKVVLTTPENTTVLAKTEVYNPETQAKKVVETQTKKVAAATLPPVIKDPAQIEAKTQTQEKQAKVQPKTEQKADQKKAQTSQKFDIIKPENLPKAETNKQAELPDVIKNNETKNEVSESELKNEGDKEAVEDTLLSETETETLPPPPENVKEAKKSELVLFFESKTFWGSAAGFVLLLLLAIYLKAKKKMKEIIGEDDIDLDLEKVKANKQESPEPIEEGTDEETESKVNLYRLLNQTEGDAPEEVEDTYSDDLVNLLDVDNVASTVSDESGKEELSQVNDDDIVFEDMVVDEAVETPSSDDNVETEFVLDDIVIENSENEEHEDNLFELNTENQEEPVDNTPENAIDDYMKYLADNPEKLERSDTSVSVDEDVEEISPVEEIHDVSEPEIALVDISDEETQMVENSYNDQQDIYSDAEVSENEVNITDSFVSDEEEIKLVPAEFEQTDVNSLFEREDFASDIMQTSDEEEIKILNGESDYEESTDNEPIFGEENNVLDLNDYKQTVKVHQPVVSADDEEITDEAIVDYVEEHDTPEEDNSVVLENGLKVISQVQIKKNAGLYMVDYEGNHALIGFKNDNYYVLKNFDEVPKRELQARLYDKAGRKEQYLVKLGSEKMIVEFNQKEIKHVMDL